MVFMLLYQGLPYEDTYIPQPALYLAAKSFFPVQLLLLLCFFINVHGLQGYLYQLRVVQYVKLQGAP